MSQQGSKSNKDIELNRIQVLSMADGFIESSILFTLLKLKVFEAIGEGSKTLTELAEELNARPDTLVRLLNAGVLLKLLISRDGVSYQVAPDYRSILLPSGGEQYLGNFILNLAYIYSALDRLDEAAKNSGPTIDPSIHLGADKGHTREFVLAMHNYASIRGHELATFLDTTNNTSLLDIGCGPGTYAFQLGLRNPELKLYLSDLSEILEVAKEIQERYGVKNEVHYLPLDAVKDKLPGTYDIILVSNTLHVLGERESRRLIKRLYKSINQGGSLVIQANFLRDDHMGERWPVFLDVIKLCITYEGRNHSVKETKNWLKDAGFVKIEYNPMTIFNSNSFLRAYKP